MRNGYRPLGISPCIVIILDPEHGKCSWRPAPIFDKWIYYVHTRLYRPICVYQDVNTRFIHEDLFANLAQYIRRASRNLDR